MEKERCTVWKDLGKISFNFFDTATNKEKKISKFGFYNHLEKESKKLKGKIVINAGHYIPNLHNQEQLGKYSVKTWKFACSIVKKLFKNGIDAYVSLIINDLPFTPEERTKLNIVVPKKFKEIADKEGVRILNYSDNPHQPFTEKKLANKFSSQKKSKKWDVYGEEISNMCVQAIIAYQRDLKKQGAVLGVWIVPKCTHHNLIESLKIFEDEEDHLRTICYFETPNCFQ